MMIECISLALVSVTLLNKTITKAASQKQIPSPSHTPENEETAGALPEAHPALERDRQIPARSRGETGGKTLFYLVSA